jgi:MYXO-CTERM domain-containing protein
MAGIYRDIQISVGDGSATTPLPAFTITVAGSPGSGGTPVPVMNGWWLMPGILAGLGLLRKKRRK